jgi:Raf kinase inhibitor-like YbhB/YbcL family protein
MEGKTVTMTIASSAFAPNGAIPSRHTCEGADISPQLSWHGAPPGTRSLALVVDDPDAPDPAAPRMTWVHWVLYDIPPSASGLAEGVARGALPEGTREGRNDFGRTTYGGPCPPIGRHRYYFKLYALDTVLRDLRHPDKATLEKSMQGHVLAQAALVGTYQKAR